jgi:hypothetical protein
MQQNQGAGDDAPQKAASESTRIHENLMIAPHSRTLLDPSCGHYERSTL